MAGGGRREADPTQLDGKGTQDGLAGDPGFGQMQLCVAGRQPHRYVPNGLLPQPEGQALHARAGVGTV